MAAQTLSPLEQIAMEFNGQRNPEVLLDLINQYYIANGKTSISHLDFDVSYATRSLGLILGFNEKNGSQMKQRLIELGIFSPDLADYDQKGREEIIENLLKNILRKGGFSSYYLEYNNSKSENNKKIIAASQQIKDYLLNLGIHHLDEIKAGYSRSKSIANILSFNISNSNQMKQRLVDLGIYPAKLADYTVKVQEKIIENIIAKLSNPGFSSFYLLPKNPHAEENRKFVATSQKMKDYLLNVGINQLDDVNEDTVTKGLRSVLDINKYSPKLMRKQLIDLGLFSPNLADYSPEMQAQVIKNIIDNRSNHSFSSFYLSRDTPFAEDNKRLVVNSKQVRDFLNDYLIQLQISHLDNMRHEHATTGLGNILGFKGENLKNMRQRLVELKIFSPNLADYSPEMQGRVIKNLIEKISNPRFLSFYLSKNNPYANYNLRLVATSQKMKDYLLSIGINHLDDVESKHATTGLGSMLGFKPKNPKQMRQRLVNLGVFSIDLLESSYDSLREDICQKMVNNLSTSSKPSYYTSPDLDERILQSNREIILASNAVQTFFAQQGYYMNDPTTMNDKVRLLFRKYIGAEDIGGIIGGRRFGDNGINRTLYRRIHHDWKDEEKEFLRDYFFRDCNGNELIFITNLLRQREGFEGLFGVSYKTVIDQCKYMGLIHREENGGTREQGVPVYAFPSIHEQEFCDFLRDFQNRTFLLNNNIYPTITPVFAFIYRRSGEGERREDEEFNVATLPIKYKGVNVENYTQAEQAIISAVQHYISDNSKFRRNANSDIIINPTEEHDFEPQILQIRGPNNLGYNLIQLTFRKRFNPTNEVSTIAIDIGRGREVYLFQHELYPTYQNTRV